MDNSIKNLNDLKNTLDRIGRPLEVKIYRRNRQELTAYDLEYLLNIAKTHNCIARLEYYDPAFHSTMHIDIEPNEDINVYKRLLDLV